jgi:hypothetical protein
MIYAFRVVVVTCMEHFMLRKVNAALPFYLINRHFFFFFFYPAFTTLYEFEPFHLRRSEITHSDTTQSVRPLWMSDQPVAETST